MKSIFRKIAFVLALVMVVGLLPVKTAAADVKDNKYARKKNATLYVGGEATRGDYESCWSVQTTGKKLKTDEKYTISYVSSNPDVATVNKYGLVEAVSVGETTITVTFSKDGKEDIVESFGVKVKKNAVNVALDKDSQAALEAGLLVGDEPITLVAVQTASDDKNDATDTVKFYCGSKEDKEIIDLDAATGKLTAKKAGEATVVVYTYQTEYDSVTKKYATVNTAKSEEYKIAVKEAGIVSVKQVSTDTVALTCGSADVAAALANDFSALNVQYMLGENSIQTFVKAAAVDGNNNKVVNVTLYSAMEKGVVYKFTYKEKSVELTAADPDAIASIRIVTTQVPVQTECEIQVQFLDANGVIINPGTNSLTFTAEDSSDYSLYPMGNNKGCIFFYEAGKSARVTATYEMGWDEKGNKLPDKTATAVIESKVALDANNMIGYAVANVGRKASELTYTTGVLNIVKGEELQLYAKYNANKLGGGTSDFYNESSVSGEKLDGNFYFKYVSTNDAVVFVNELTGIMKGNNTGTAQIIIYRVIGDKEFVVGAVTVKVESTRVFTSIDMTLNKTKLSDASTGETAEIVIDAKDQLSAAIGSNLSYSAKLVNNVPGVTLTVGNSGTVLTADGYRPITGTVDSNNGNVKFNVSVTVDPAVASGPKSIQISIEATQGYPAVTKVLGRSLQVKYPGEVRSHSLDVSRSTMDVNLLQASSSWNDLKSWISLNAYDQDGFYVRSEVMANSRDVADGQYGFEITKGNVALSMAGTCFSAITTSGSSIVKKVSGTAVDSTGTYTVKVYKGVATGTPQQYKVKSIVVTDTTVYPTVTISNNRVSSIAPQYVLSDLNTKLHNGELVMKRSGNNISANFIINSVYCRDVSSDRVYVESIEVVETIRGGMYDGKTFTYWLPVNQVFYTN